MEYDLIVIDGQRSFLDPKGALYVKGADQEALLVASLIENGGEKILNLWVSEDQHPQNHIGHPGFWTDENGEQPSPFTQIRSTETRWRPRVTDLTDYVYRYLARVEARGRNVHTVWPEHCLIGDEGSNIYMYLQFAYRDWCDRTGRWINFRPKGRDPLKEYYSMWAPEDATQPDRPEDLDQLARSPLVVWTGWAGSHCVRFSGLDVREFRPEILMKSIFLTDVMAPVPNTPGGPDFAKDREDFLLEMQQAGAKLMTTREFMEMAA